MPATDSRLAREISHQANQIASAITTRRYHPSYGFTKASILADYYRLEGMITAWAYETSAWDKPAAITPAALDRLVIEGGLDLDLTTLRQLALNV